jgi:hypothetical protein
MRRLDKLPKRRVTVTELLNQDGIKELLDGVSEHINEIEDLIIIYTCGGKIFRYDNTDMIRLIQLLETVKFDILYERYEGE